MFGIGSTELLVILVVALIVLGPKSLANISRSLGKAMGEFRRVSTDFQRTLNAEAEEEEQRQRKKNEATVAPEATKETLAAKVDNSAQPTGAAAFADSTPATEAIIETTAVQTPAPDPLASVQTSAEEGTTAASAQSPSEAGESADLLTPPPGSPLADALARAKTEAETADAKNNAEELQIAAAQTATIPSSGDKA